MIEIIEKINQNRIKRFRNAHPDYVNKTDIEVLCYLNYLNYHKDMKKEIDITLKRLFRAIQKAERK